MSYIKGFTLMELIVVIAMMAVIASMVFLSFFRFGEGQVLKSDVSTVASFFEEAKISTQASKDASRYGVLFSEEGVILFKGESYNTSLEIKNHTFHRSVRMSDINLTEGRNEIVFKRLSGEADNEGEIILSDDGGNSITIKFHYTGIVEVI